MLTLRHGRATLNVCIPYASRDEIAYATNRCVQEKRVKEARQRANGEVYLENGLSYEVEKEGEAISIQDIDSNMMLAHSPPLDILVRTSGVCRLSDFMLWQVGSRLISER